MLGAKTRPSRLIWLVVSFVLASVNACRKPSSVSEKNEPAGLQVAPNLQGNEPPTVLFEIKPSSVSPGSANFQLYDCTYQARGGTAKFGLQFKQGAMMEGKPPMASAEGKFLAYQGSENTGLLEDLGKALEAKKITKNSKRIAELPFDAVILGEQMSRNP